MYSQKGYPPQVSSSGKLFAVIQFLCKDKIFTLETPQQLVKIYGECVEATMYLKWCAKFDERREDSRLTQGRRQSSTLDTLVLEATFSTMMCLCLLAVETDCLE